MDGLLLALGVIRVIHRRRRVARRLAAAEALPVVRRRGCRRRRRRRSGLRRSCGGCRAATAAGALGEVLGEAFGLVDRLLLALGIVRVIDLHAGGAFPENALNTL